MVIAIQWIATFQTFQREVLDDGLGFGVESAAEEYQRRFLIRDKNSFLDGFYYTFELINNQK